MVIEKFIMIRVVVIVGVVGMVKLSRGAVKVVRYMIKKYKKGGRPSATVKELVEALDYTYGTIRSILNELRTIGIIEYYKERKEYTINDIDKAVDFVENVEGGKE